jgi:hypothetical protein
MSAPQNTQAMEHPRIDDEHILDRYLAGRLTAEDEAGFEEHLFACADCLEKVQWGEELRRDLRSVAAATAAEQAARTAVSLGLVAWLRSRRPGQLAGILGAVLALIVLPALLLWQQAELSRLRSASPRLASQGLAEPLGNLQVVPLGVVRDAADAVQIRLDPGRDAVLLSLELPTVRAAHYRVTLRDAAGAVRWRGEGLEPNLYESLMIALPSSYLAPGSYRITVEALSASGAEPAGEMKLRVSRRE